MNNNSRKTKKKQTEDDVLTIVGIGASAGGLKALNLFFKNVAGDSGLAYVVVLHLSPEHKSVLAELLQPHVKMPVRQVTNTTKIEANNVYVIPPNANLNSIDTHLRLSELEEKRSERAPIDHFFRTLAKTHDGHAIGVILTGMGTDGTLGLKDIKEKGGLTVVQDPLEADYDGMPQSAISTGLIDKVLPITEIPEFLKKYMNSKPGIKFAENEKELDKKDNLLIQKIFALIVSQTGRNFVHYKMSTLMRRLQRRMQLHQIEELEAYLEKLHKNKEEVRLLSDDFLINVTRFFRDKKVYEHLQKKVIPALLKNKKPDDQIRIWSVGCATGEEAYSLAILFNEATVRKGLSLNIQIFASDLHDASLENARKGFFPGDISADVNAERLNRFFTKENQGYRIRKDLREMVIFTAHNLLSDPPFSRLDMVICRNLLIYLKRTDQRDVFELFHYALLPKGYLVLGISENLESADLFLTENKEYSVYQKKDVTGPEPRLPVFRKLQTYSRETNNEKKVEETISPNTMHQRLIERYGPPSILISSNYQILHVSENAGKFLLMQRGEPSKDIFRLIREELSLELRTAIHNAEKEKIPVHSNVINITIDGKNIPLVLTVHSINDSNHENSILVFFEEITKHAGLNRDNKNQLRKDTEHASRVKELEEELSDNRQRLQSIIEEYETSREEMKASNEELQSANEELRSTLEELETSKEELQSVNEELTTLNQENKLKVEELSQLSDDLVNLFAATDIATLFLNRDLHIMRFTPKLSKLFNIRSTDLGRPISDITNKLGYNEIKKDAKKVLENLRTIEKEICDKKKHTYLTTFLPYRSSDDKIAGVVITFLDITKRKQAEEVLKESEQLYRTLYSNIDDGFMLVEPVFSNDNKTTERYVVLDVNQVWEHQTGLKTNDVLGKNVEESFPQMEDFWTANFAKILRTGKPMHFEGYNKQNGCWYDLYAFNYKRRQVGVFFRDITKRKQLEEQIRENEELYRALFDNTEDGFILCEPVFANNNKCSDLIVHKVNNAFINQSGINIDKNNFGKRMSEFWPNLKTEWYNTIGEVIKNKKSARFEAFNDHSEKWFEVHGFPFKENRIGVFIKDITYRKKAEKILSENNLSLEKQVKEHLNQLQQNEDLLTGIAEAQAISLAALKAIRNESGDIVDFLVLFANSMTELLAGINNITGQKISQIVPEILQTDVFRDCCVLVDNGESLENEYYFERDGMDIWIRTIAVKTGDGLVINIEDITTRKKGEQELLKMADEMAKLSNDRYKMLFEMIDEGVCIMETLVNKKHEPADYRFIEVNPAFEKITGFTNVAEKRVKEIIPELDPSWYDFLRGIVESDKSVHIEKQAEFLDNRWFNVFGFRIGGREKNQLAVFLSEITERKNLEQKIKRLGEKLNIVMSTVEVAMVEHDELNNEDTYFPKENWAAILGYQTEQLPNDKNFMQWFMAQVHPDDQDKIKKYIAIY